jgi:nitrate/nitrite transporter NarK
MLSLPVGVAGGTTVFVCGGLSLERFPLRWRLLVGCALSAGGSLLLSFAHERTDYWKFMFPAFLIGSSGSAFIYVR